MERIWKKESFRLRNFIMRFFRHLKMADLQRVKSLESVEDLFLIFWNYSKAKRNTMDCMEVLVKKQINWLQSGWRRKSRKKKQFTGNRLEIRLIKFWFKWVIKNIIGELWLPFNILKGIQPSGISWKVKLCY